MKKVLFLLLAVVISAAVLAAGCTSAPSETAQDTQVKTPTSSAMPAAALSVSPSDLLNDETVLVVTVEKTGTIYNIGDEFVVILPSNPSTGYNWNITKNEGLSIEQEYIAPEDTSLVGAPGVTKFTIKGTKAGTFAFTAKYMRSWEGEDSAVYVFDDSITIEDTGAAALTEPRCITTYTGNLNPAAGEKVYVMIPQAPNDDLIWGCQAENSGCIIDNDIDSITYNDDGTWFADRMGWYLTAESAGKYTFDFEVIENTYEDVEPLTAFDLDFTFV